MNKLLINYISYYYNKLKIKFPQNWLIMINNVIYNQSIIN